MCRDEEGEVATVRAQQERRGREKLQKAKPGRQKGQVRYLIGHSLAQKASRATHCVKPERKAEIDLSLSSLVRDCSPTVVLTKS
jgi:hypothetical protein